MRRWRAVLLLVAGGVVLAFLIGELAVRILTGTVFVWGDAEVIDPVAGRTLRPGLTVRHPFKLYSITAGEHGTRSNGSYQAQPRPLTVAVGDSFTYGEDVSDDQTWPAQLERRTGHRVINGGVAGFGLDQTVLRAEQLDAIYAPDTIIASFIPNDVERVEMSTYGWRMKPYFEIADDTLVLHPAPVPRTSPWLPSITSKSLLMLILLHSFAEQGGAEFVWAHHQGREVSCLLMKRLAGLATQRPVNIVVVAQPQEASESDASRDLKDAVLSCARAQGLWTLDLFPAIEGAAAGTTPLFMPDHGHMTPAGNAFVAAALGDLLQSSPRRE